MAFHRERELTTMRLFLPWPGTPPLELLSPLTSVLGWSLHQMDVKIAFLNGIIEEEVYIEQPEGFVVHGSDSHVCRLKKVLYRLK